jgi:aminomethyltransferase
MSKENSDLKKTPLYEKHIQLGARMVPFAGWNMPVQYTGIIDEHMHTRLKVGLFDICHMGEFILKGPTAEKDIDRIVTCRIDNMTAGKCKYGFMLKPGGTIVDDMIVFKIADDEFMLVVNVGTIDKEKGEAWLKSNISEETIFSDTSDEIAKLDIQGPLAKEVMKKVVDASFMDAIKKYYFDFTEIEGVKTLVSRTGYTGELGYELFFPAENAERFWELFIGQDNVKPIGLGARDTLRLEMGYCLYGHDINEAYTPFEANLARFVYQEKDFIGKEGLLATDAKKALTGFICEGRRSAKEGYNVIIQGKNVGKVTSGTFSPCLKKGIGLCYVEKDALGEGKEIILTDGKVEIKANLKNIPLYKKEGS